MSAELQEQENEMSAAIGWKEGLQLLVTQSAMLSLLPVERWLEELRQSEEIAPWLDPTLYRDYLYSGKGEVIKDVLQAAVQLKRAVESARAKVLSGEVREVRR